MKIIIIESINFVYPSENFSNGVAKIRLCLCHDIKKTKYFCAVGEGSKDWVTKNGKRKSFEFATSFFNNIESLEENWII